jgi:hypothetical protein
MARLFVHNPPKISRIVKTRFRKNASLILPRSACW